MFVTNLSRLVMSHTIKWPPNLYPGYIKQSEFDRTTKALSQHVLLDLLGYRQAHVGFC